MTAITDWINDNWKAIECTTYSSLGLGAYGAAWASAFTPAAIKALGWAAIGGAFELAYNLAGCDDGPITPPPEGNGCAGMCWKSSEGRDMFVAPYGSSWPLFPQATNVVQILSVEWNSTKQTWDVSYIQADGTNGIYSAAIVKTVAVCASLQGPGACEEESPDTVPPPHDPEEPIGPPTVHQDGECTWTITPIDAYVDASGVAHIYYRVEPSDPSCGDAYEFWSSDRGPRFVQPNPDNPNPTPPPEHVTCPDPCKDYDEEFEWIIDKLKQIEQCACNGKTKPVLEGTWISTHWRSDADSPNSNRPLRKLFRYRSKSIRTADELQAYWSDFVWTSGPVCVIHKGAWWGTPQVWAATEAEGQRVIRRAGAEAGLDPDQTGEWLTRSSHSPRYGMSRQMRLDTTPGERWVTRREGPSGFPEL